MHDRDSGTVERALAVLRAVDARDGTAQTPAVALALWCLRGHCPDEWLRQYWDAAGSDHEIGRGQGLLASLNGIELRVKR